MRVDGRDVAWFTVGLCYAVAMLWVMGLGAPLTAWIELGCPGGHRHGCYGLMNQRGGQVAGLIATVGIVYLGAKYLMAAAAWAFMAWRRRR